MGKMLQRLAAPALVVLGTAGITGLAAMPAGASTKSSPKPAQAKATKKPAAHHSSGAVDLRGVVVKVDATTGRLELRVGKHEVTIKATAAELKRLKRGETVIVHGKVVHRLRVATSISKA